MKVKYLPPELKEYLNNINISIEEIAETYLENYPPRWKSKLTIYILPSDSRKVRGIIKGKTILLNAEREGILTSLYHELIHLTHPNLSEKQVEKKAKQLASSEEEMVL